MAINKNLSSAEYFYNNNDLEAAKKICKTILIDDKFLFIAISIGLN
jgi:hypothetical protein